jgi:23S rRNA (cytosine1962-C5)-methyltransferase
MRTDQLLPAIDERLRTVAGPDARRIFHGRGGLSPGLEAVVVDWFPPVALVTLYDPEAEPLLDPIAGRLVSGLDGLRSLLVQRRYLPRAPTELLHGSLPERVWAHEDGLRYRLRLGHGMNVGFFGDMAPGRARVRSLAHGRSVLNLFSYTCSFSVAAIEGGADRVVNVDMNRSALELGRENHIDNGHDLRRVSFLRHDIFKSFGKLRRLGPFDVIVIDPPTDQGRSFTTERGWPRLLQRVPSLAAPRAHLLAALNSPRHGVDFLADGIAEHLPGAEWARLDRAGDYPDAADDGGLKILHVQLP